MRTQLEHTPCSKEIFKYNPTIQPYETCKTMIVCFHLPHISIKDKQNCGWYNLFSPNEKQKRACQPNLLAFVCISFSMIILTNECTSRNVW